MRYYLTKEQLSRLKQRGFLPKNIDFGKKWFGVTIREIEYLRNPMVDK